MRVLGVVWVGTRTDTLDETVGFLHFGPDGQTPELHPERVNFGTYLSLDDPDGNGWLIQEVP